MALYTPAQWNKIQANMPPEDRVSYEDYVRQAGGTLQKLKEAEATAATPTKVSVSAAESAAAARAKAAADKAAIAAKTAEADAALKAANEAAAKQAKEDEYYTKIISNGLTQAQLDAVANATNTANLLNQTYGGATPVSKVDPVTRKVITDTEAIKTNVLKGEEALAAERAAAEAKRIAAEKAAAEAAAKAAQEAALKAAQEAAAKAERDRIAAEAAAAAAKTAKDLETAQAALIKANADAAAAAKAAQEALEKIKAEMEAALAKAKADGDAAAIAAATAAAKAAQDAADRAAAEATAKAAESNLNVSGNVVLETAGQTTEDLAATDYAKFLAEQQKTQQRESIIAVLTDRFNKYNLSSLAKTIKDLAVDGATEATITLALQETEDYKRRFKANETRMKNNLQVLNPAEYLNLEDGYRQVLRAYGLKQFDTDEYVSQFIANDVSAAEMSNRVVTAVQRVQNADPAIQKQLRDYYGIGQEDLVAYVLDPQQQFQKIERQVAASEIGVAAGRQGLKAGVGVAEQLAAQGVTQAEAQKGYATIADILPTAEKLSEIYGKTMDTYGQSEAEQEVFNSLASAQRKRQQLTAREIAAFSGMSGTNRTSLTTSSVGQF
jgi:hypothetical protein